MPSSKYDFGIAVVWVMSFTIILCVMANDLKDLSEAKVVVLAGLIGALVHGFVKWVGKKQEQERARHNRTGRVSDR